jgi:hypothetical protein
MLFTVAKLALITTAIVFFTTSFTASADAQRVHSRCVKSKDQVKCTCLLRNGGRRERRPGATRVTIYMYSGADVDRFIACMRRNGRPNG